MHPAHMRRCIFGRAAGFLGSSGIKKPPDCSVGRGRCRSDPEFLAVLGVVFVKAVRVHGHDAVDIFVRVERLGLELDHGDGDVRAVVGHTLAVGEQVVEGKAVVERALAGLQAVDVCSFISSQRLSISSSSGSTR